MGRFWPGGFIATFALAPLIGIQTGCNRNDQMADVPQLRAAEVVAPEKQPLPLRPPKGSSAGMNYDPGGPPP
jgi:hypothetical protein